MKSRGVVVAVILNMKYVKSMASRFTIYSINQIPDLIYQISYIIYKISDILY